MPEQAGGRSRPGHLRKAPAAEAELKKLAAELNELRRRDGRPPAVLFMDEGRFGRISERADCCAPRLVRALVPRQVVRESLYAFAAAEPKRGRSARRTWKKCNTASISLFLLDLLALSPDHRLLLVLR